MPVAIYNMEYVERIELDRSLLTRAISEYNNAQIDCEMGYNDHIPQHVISELQKALSLSSQPLPNKRKSG